MLRTITVVGTVVFLLAALIELLGTLKRHPPTMLDPKTFPRPPALEKVAAHLLVKWPNGGTIAETRNGFRVLETYHPPTYYIPRSDAKVDLASTSRASFCEWKGRAKYFSIKDPSGNEVRDRVWMYENPTARFKDIDGYLSFYTGPWECYVDGEKVEPQPGDFYGGWLTSDIKRESVKGGPGTLGW